MSEAEVEEMCLAMLGELGYDVIYGPDISEDGIAPERSYGEVVLVDRLRRMLRKINKLVPDAAIEEAVKKVLRTESQNLIENNHSFHRLITDGVSVQYKKVDGTVKDDVVWLFDHQNVSNNEFLAINQFTIKEERYNRRPDIILFVNGLPLVIVELKNPSDEKADLLGAYKQLETYKQEISSIFRYNEILVISDGTYAEAGTLTAKEERFSPWKTINGKKQPTVMSQIEMLIKGMLNPSTLLDLVRHFIVYEAEKDKKEGSVKVSKKIAAYHQYSAVQKAVASTVVATKKDRKAGVVWHTQGSGKSLTMVFYTGKMVLNPQLENPTVIVLTDRNDLDDQLLGTFSRCHELLRQEPKQATNRDQLKELLQVSSGGIIFTTIQKFFPDDKSGQYPMLSDRKNIIIIADEAHRSQYGFGLKVPKDIDKESLKYGYAKYLRDALPNASFIAFTGTPIEKTDRSTPAVFGSIIDTYDVNQAVEDGATVKIYYENRLVKIDIKPEERPYLDDTFEEITEGEEIAGKEYLKSKWSRIEKVVGSSERIQKIAKDIVEHWENRLSVLEGKAMIVCMSRRICIELHNEIVKLRPEWYSKDDTKGTIKVIMTGSATDGPDWQEHIRNKQRRHDIGERLKDPSDPLKIIIVRDMFLTGFDAPSMHTMYLDKPMKGHTLMQAIARVNRVFKEKQGGYVVDYIGIATELKQALAEYADSDKKQTGIPQEQAIALMMERYETVQAFFNGYNYKQFFTAQPKERLTIIIEAMEQVLKQKDGKERYLKETTTLLYAFTLSVPHEQALKIRDDVGFFQAIKAALIKNTETKQTLPQEYDSAIKQILSKAIVSDRVIDVFAAAGFKKPNINILDEEFLAEIKGMPQKNLAFEALKRLLADRIRFIQKKNIVQARSFEELLDKTIKAYTNKSIETAQVIQQLVDLARKIRDEQNRGAELNLSTDEVAFYDALVDHPGVKEVMEDEQLKIIARELVQTIRSNVRIDWTLRESVQAQLRVAVKRVLRKYGYPPDKQQKATDTVLEQAKTLAKNWEETPS
ncbi:MAG: type I restriction endonuclease subunit R [Candidatus Bathyarchaeota archaeon]|nr:type I restriction endonuclease subunit R [Candidatus Termiticorpusculum sp.]